jgi:hypothetical protein
VTAWWPDRADSWVSPDAHWDAAGASALLQPFELRESRFRCPSGGTGLEPLDIENRKAFAEGRRLTKGYYIDFIGNFDRSAKDGLAIYRISGGAGFVWVASFDQKGGGSLRLAEVDASALYPEFMARSQPESQNSNAHVERQRVKYQHPKNQTQSLLVRHRNKQLTRQKRVRMSCARTLRQRNVTHNSPKLKLSD